MSRITRVLALLLAIAIISTACASTPAAAPPQGTQKPQASTEPAGKTGKELAKASPEANRSGGTLTRAMTDEPVAIDPQGAANSGMNVTLPYLFDTLIARQKDGKYVPLLAESLQASPDGKSIDFKLKKGVKFHDGSPLNAAAVVFTFNRFKQVGDRSPIISGIREISRVEEIDEHTVRFGFDKPTATFLNTIAMPYASILSPSAVQAAGDEMGSKPVGTGPFKLGEWKRGVSITLVRNPDYSWGTPEVQNRGPVYIDQLVYKLIPDASTQLAALQSGDIDVMFISEPSHIDKLKKDKNVQVEEIDLDALIYLGYNSQKPPFNEVKVRQAFSHAVNKAEIIKTALGGLGTEAFLPLTPSMLGYNAALKSYGQDYDPARAKALLTEAGFVQGADGIWERDGQKLAGRLLTSTRAPNEAIATVLQSQFKALGVPVEIQQLDSAAVQKATNEGAFDILLWRYEWTDPDALNTYLGGSRVRQTNRVFYANPEVDKLLEQGVRELDAQKRAEIYEEAQKLILADAPWQPLYIPRDGLVFRSHVKGVVISTLGRMLLNDVTLSER